MKTQSALVIHGNNIDALLLRAYDFQKRNPEYIITGYEYEYKTDAYMPIAFCIYLSEFFTIGNDTKVIVELLEKTRLLLGLENYSNVL